MELYEKFDTKLIESQIKDFNSFHKVKEVVENEARTKASPSICFIEGPPTMNGEPHLGHIRGRIIKDFWYRFKTLQGYHVIFRAGWDTQGLPVELQAEKNLGVTGNKNEIINKVGIENIVNACKKLILENNRKWIEVDNLLGLSFDYDNAYWTYQDKYIEREWMFLKKAHETGILKEWFRVVAYCPSCQTSLSNAEVNQGYETVNDPSYYYKVKLTEEENVYLVIWTTMPFTIVTDELVGVNPKENYCYVKFELQNKDSNNYNNEVWIIGETRLPELMQYLGISDYKVIKQCKGQELANKEYIHPLLNIIPGLRSIKEKFPIHRIVSDDFVDITTGSGLVHLSPANGEEDFEIAARLGLPIFVPIDDKVMFNDEAGIFQGLFVRDADEKVINEMSKVNSNIKIDSISHQYPTCWRSHHKIVWLARREYFYMINKLGSMPYQAATSVEYYYEQPKNRYLEIIKEQVPWCISRERVWGTPLPIWICSKCNTKEYLFSRQEIIDRAYNLPDGSGFELHRPWIDRVEIKCKVCNNKMVREHFVLDTWHNSGSAPFASLSDDQYKKLIPSIFMTEGIDQTRGWAYTLLMLNVILNSSPLAPFKSFLFQGHVLDEKGNKMSKSLGNVINAKELLSTNSVDLIRFYFMWKSSPIESINFSIKEMKTRPYQILSTLYYLHIFFKQNSEYDNFDKDKNNLDWASEKKILKLPDLWILSKFQGLVNIVSELFERCRFHEGTKAIEEYIISQLSQTYIPMIRNDLWEDTDSLLNNRLAKYSVIRYILKNIDILLHPISPFITEYLYQTCFNNKNTILTESWPQVKSTLVKPDIESLFDVVKEIISIANATRMKAKIKRRWPLSTMYVCIDDINDINQGEINDLIKNQVNVESISFIEIKSLSNLDKLYLLLKNNLPFTPLVSLNRKRLAPVLKSSFPLVLKSFENINPKEVVLSIVEQGKFSLSYGNDNNLEITSNDIDVSYDINEGYEFSERGSLIVILDIKRDKKLTAKGLLRDLARNTQQVRKELGYNPTEILKKCTIYGLNNDDIDSLNALKNEFLYLVRVKDVVFVENNYTEININKTLEIDDRKIGLKVE